MTHSRPAASRSDRTEEVGGTPEELLVDAAAAILPLLCR